MLQSVQELPPGLFHLEAANCKRLQSLPELPSRLDELDASVLDKLFKQGYKGIRDSRLLEFSNCMRLKENTNNNVLADSQQIIQHMTTTSLREFYEGVDNGVLCGFSICLPGSRIPNWFNHRSPGSSITIQLPQLCGNKNLIGFAVCVVIAFEDDFHADRDFGVNCYYGFETNPGVLFSLKSIPSSMALDDYIIYDSDHICLGYSPCSPYLYHRISFSFCFEPAYLEEKVKVKCCGVSPVYAYPIQTKPNTFTVNMVPPTEEECRKLHSEFSSGGLTSIIHGDTNKLQLSLVI